MKKLFEIFLLSLLVLLAACEEEVPEVSLPVPDANGYVTCSMELNGGVVAYEGATRSSNGYEWNDGDRLYIRFATDKDTVLGFANYNSIKDEWQVSYAGSLNAGVTQNCEVYFFENATHKDNTTVELTVLSAIYQDTAAVYRFESNTVSLSATLHPKTGRVRFVSQNRDEFSLAGIRYYIGFDLSNKEFNLNYRRRLVLNAHKQQDNGEYSTDYLYGFYEENYDGNVRKEVPLGLDIINHADTSRVYHKDFALEMLNAGNSGYITLPSESTNQGWSVDKFNGGRYFAKWKYIGPDMSAAGGVLLNGNVIFDYDDSWYYCWGDRDSDGDYLTDGVYYTGTGSISKTKYDLAYAWYNDFGGYMPAKTAVSQMLSLNKYSNFCLVSDDFNVLALGSTYGYEDLESSEDYDVESKYLWTASAISSTTAYAAVFTDNGYEVKSMHKKYGMGFLITFDKELANNNNDHRSYNGINNGYEYADLGLPSGTKWATCNVGATKPEEYGGYYAWGETEEKEDYSWETYKWCNGSETSITKYCTASSYGTVDNKTVLDLEDDVAHVNWGSSWRMPTREELLELRDYCSWEWSVINGVSGYRVTSKTNGNSIFFSAAGYCQGSEVYYNSSSGNYCSSSLYSDCSNLIYYLYFRSGYCNWLNSGRYIGFNVRPVCGNEKTCQITVSSSGNGTAAIKGRDKTSFAFIVGSTVTVVATPNDGYAFYGWFVEGTDNPVSTDSEYSFNLSENISLVAKFVVTGCVAVDLGLPSGTKWASFNVGATRPEEYGGYYAWGETEEKEDYSWETYKWCEGSSTTMTKYCTDGKYGTVDGKTVLEPEDDVAHVKWGGDWRMPTVEEKVELSENCDCEMTTLNGVVGYVITSRVNGNSIFLPAAGFRRVDELDNVGDAYYWLNSTHNDYADMLYPAYFDVNGLYTYVREYGQSVRPVCGNAVEAPVAEYTVSVVSEENGHAMIKGRSGSSVTVGASSIVTVAATPDEGYRLEGWYVEGTDSLVSSKTEYSFTVNGDVALVAKFDVLVYEAVDLGLPSGIKWATFNVGATRPEEYGCYYAWGETEEKDNYVWSTYKWCEGRDSTITKYCTDSSYGRVDGKAMLDPEDDVAHVKWGGEWRMPTYGEQQELMDNCDWEWIQLNDVNGYKVTSKSNGNSIFLPAAGWSARYGVGTYGYYWSASVKSYGVYAMNTNIDSCGLNGYSRNVGLPIRPVCGEVAVPVEKYTVTVSSEGGGNVAIKDADGATVKFEAGVSVTVVATPDEGYAFSGWYVDGTETPVSTDAEYTFTVSEDIALVAKFSKKPVVKISCNDGGAVSFKEHSGDSIVVSRGTELTIVATPDEAYAFEGWYTGSTETPVSTNAEYTFTVIEDVALVARFEVNEPGSANGDYYVKYGADVMVERSDRYPRSVGIVGAQSPQQQLNDIASASSHAAYFDKTSTVFEVKSGETVTPTILYTGTWMHGYVFVDWDNSKQFEVNLEGDGPFTKGEGNELMCWSFYGKDGEDIGWNSAGESSNWGGTVAPGSFRVPDGLVTGSTYRMRFAIMWNCIDPSGDYADFIRDGGSIIDVTLKIIGDADDETDPSPFDSDKLYTISSQRAFLLYQPSTNALVASTGTAVNAVQNPQDPNQQFQIKRNSSGYQLYSVGAGGYAVYQSTFNVRFDSNAGSKLTITETGNSAYPWKLQLGDYYMNAQDEGQCSTGLRVDTWSHTDNGNSYILEEIVPL